MKRIFLIFLAVFTITQAFSQGKITFFSQDGKKFWVIINGKKINSEPQFNVSEIPVDFQYGKARIIFEDEKIKPIDKNVQVVDVDNNWVHVKYMIKNKKGKYIISDLNATFEVLGPMNPLTSNTVTETIQQQINTPADTINLQKPETNNPQTATSQTGHTTTPVTQVPNRCSKPMDKGDFDQFKQSLTSKNFEDSKLTLAKQVAETNCLTCTQIKDILLLFNFESTRLEFAKWSFPKVYDPGNYFKLNDAFKFESSVEELEQYVRQRR